MAAGVLMGEKHPCIHFEPKNDWCGAYNMPCMGAITKGRCKGQPHLGAYKRPCIDCGIPLLAHWDESYMDVKCGLCGMEYSRKGVPKGRVVLGAVKVKKNERQKE